MEKPLGPLSAVFSLLILSGCTALPRHDLDISDEMREKPVRQVHVMPPYFAADMKRADPGDFRQMLPENRRESSEKILASLQKALGASLTVDSAWVPGPNDLEWSRKIGEELAIGRVALGTAPLTCPVESILVTGVVGYGTEKDQVVVHPLPFLPWMKPKVFGSVRWDHVTDLEIMLVRPADGKVLFTLRHDERINTGFEDSALLDESLAKTAEAAAEVFRKTGEKTGPR